MKPTNDWISDWRYGLKPGQEAKTAEELIGFFQNFWLWANIETKSKSTRQRYSAALHALGGYLVEETGNGHRGSKTILEFLKDYIDSGEGPLIYQDNEAWQNELDAVCRRLYKYLATQR
jgi:hypothetical protein